MESGDNFMPRANRAPCRSDYSLLLRELQAQNTPAEIAAILAAQPAPQPVFFDAERNRKMSDETNRFVYVPKWNTIHDKSCDSVKSIPTEDLQFLHDLVPGARQCPACELRRCLRIGARDGMRLKHYQRFFDATGVPKELYHHMYITMGVQTRLMNDTLILWHRQDEWKIERTGSGTGVILWHNNYYINRMHERVFCGGFHRQLSANTLISFKTALHCIDRYEPAVHIVTKKIEPFRPQIEAACRYFKSQDLALQKRQGSVVLRIAYRVQCFWRALPLSKNSAAPSPISWLFLAKESPIPEQYQTDFCGYIWKSKSGDYFFDVGKLNREQSRFSTMFNKANATIGVESVVAYCTIE